GIAEEMGAVLVRSSWSSNIKERRDCSCALYDAGGQLVAQAEHIPVHLGAMHDSVRAVRERAPEPGDVFVLNDPYAGGTHLPDVTVVTPVDVGGEVIAYAVSRAHHSDVGGMVPGSMPSASRSIFQEGIVIPPLRFVRRGVPADDLLEFLLANVRTPDFRRADLTAQIAANDVGSGRLQALVGRYGLDWVEAAFDETVAYGQRRASEAVRALPDGVYRATGEVEGDGTDDVDIPLAVTVTVEGDRIVMDFGGTADPVAGNINCPRSVTLSACLFALRVALGQDLPMNAGTAAPLEVRLPSPCVANAQWPAAVVAGNVETSQRLADVILAALGQAVELPAAGQGTMNNLVIGGAGWTYYETVGGGQGASSNADGASGVHVGMSNTLNTPVEALELEFPLRVERYQLRYGTGGAGLRRGGDGTERALQVLGPATLSVIADRRRHRPAGKAGGADGACGENLLDGQTQPPKFTRDVGAGQVVSVLTPGGGGFGALEAPAG
ncbi:MAG TPA: hydantoinase B/oxoprolinase family protein, partial [Acidimicrobiales bacterium]|nr:hydantoinase B/oxoprolinase family protein [Acidimicrobiales bacterium]